MIIYTDIFKELCLIIGYTFLVYCCNHVFVYPAQKCFSKIQTFSWNKPLLSVYPHDDWQYYKCYHGNTNIANSSRRYFVIREIFNAGNICRCHFLIDGQFWFSCIKQSKKRSEIISFPSVKTFIILCLSSIFTCNDRIYNKMYFYENTQHAHIVHWYCRFRYVVKGGSYYIIMA